MMGDDGGASMYGARMLPCSDASQVFTRDFLEARHPATGETFREVSKSGCCGPLELEAISPLVKKPAAAEEPCHGGKMSDFTS